MVAWTKTVTTEVEIRGWSPLTLSGPHWSPPLALTVSNHPMSYPGMGLYLLGFFQVCCTDIWFEPTQAQPCWAVSGPRYVFGKRRMNKGMNGCRLLDHCSCYYTWGNADLMPKFQIPKYSKGHLFWASPSPGVLATTCLTDTHVACFWNSPETGYSLLQQAICI